MRAFRRVRLDWRRKAAAFRFFNAAPGGRHLYYFTQRYITRTFPRDLTEHDRWQIEHASTFRRLFRGEMSTAVLFEFGAGWDLHSSLVQWCYGVGHQIVVDITRLARPAQINHAIAHLQRHPPPGAARVPRVPVGRAFEGALHEHYGIRYVAPADARATGLPDGSVDLVCTTSVLEHVPAGVLRDIMRECYRICRDGAVVSHVVDYTDHYAHSDAAITIYNFLRFSDTEWLRYNPANHYQNRLRHFEYGDIFREAGFQIRSEGCQYSDGGAAQLADVPLAPRFAAMEPAQLLPRTGHWVLVKNGKSASAD